MMKAAIIGAGFISEFHGDGYNALPQIKLCGICDTDPDKAATMAAKLGCRPYTEAKTMLETEKPDLVSVCLPTFLHEEYTCLALKHGAHVLCEKPLSLTTEANRRMADTAREAGKLLMTAQVVRFWPEYRTIADQIREIGTPYFVEARRLQHASRTTWLQDPKKGGGVLFDLFVHDFDFLCSLFGYDPEFSDVFSVKGPEGAWRSLCVMLKFPGGPTAMLESSNLMPRGFPFTASFRADYPDACLQYSFRAPVNIQKDAKTDTEFFMIENGTVNPLPVSEGAQSLAFREEIAAFVAAAAGGHSPIPLQDTLRVMEKIQILKKLLEA